MYVNRICWCIRRSVIAGGMFDEQQRISQNAVCIMSVGLRMTVLLMVSTCLKLLSWHLSAGAENNHS
jgi:hypothetical protein